MQGGNADNKDYKRKVRRKILDSFRCSCCHPHSGENYGYGGKPDRRFVGEWNLPAFYHNDRSWYDMAFRKRKPKETK